MRMAHLGMVVRHGVEGESGQGRGGREPDTDE